MLQPEPGQVAFFPNVDAIQEFTIESNSPPAEFGRFNGGVVNLTTKSGQNALHGSVFEFARHEDLNARNFFASGTAAKPRFRRHQFGGVAGGPIRKNATFFFVDYQGQRQTIGRTVISTVPTVLQRQGVFTEAIGGRVPVIYDPATTTSAGGAATRTAFPGNTIPDARIDPVARRLLERYPLPTGSGTANNYRRVGQRGRRPGPGQRAASITTCAAAPIGCSRALTRFGETFLPVTPLPDGSGVASGALGRSGHGPGRPRRATSTSSPSAGCDELRVGDTRRSVDRAAATVDGSIGTGLGLPGIPSAAAFADTLPTFLVAGYQQLGSPPNTATEFGTSVTQIADAFTWQRGRHTVKFGADLRWSRLDVVQPPSPTGQFTFSNLFTNQPTPTAGASTTGTPFASFLLGQVQLFSIDRQQQAIRNRAHIQEYLVQDDWRVASRWTVNAGLRYTLNFPSTEVDDQVRGVQPRHGQSRIRRQGWPAARRTGAAHPQLRAAVRDRRPRHRSHRGAPRLRPGVDRDGRHHDAVHHARVPVPADGLAAHAGQHHSGVRAGRRTRRPADSAHAGRRARPGRASRSTATSAPATSSSGTPRCSASSPPNLSIEVAYVGSKITRVGLPDTNLNQLTVEQLALGPPLQQRVDNPYFGVIPRSSSLGDPTIPAGQLLKPYPQHTTVSLYRNNTGTTIYHGGYVKLEQRLTDGPLVPGVLYALEAGGRRLVGLRRVHPDRAGGQLPVADSFNRKLERTTRRATCRTSS